MLTLPRELEGLPFRAKAERYWGQLGGMEEGARLLLLRRVCAPPFRPEVDASPAWRLLGPHLDLERIPAACSLELEHAFRQIPRVRSTIAGLQALSDAFPGCLQTWLRWVPYRFCKTARTLGSLSPERVEACLRECARHPLFQPFTPPLQPARLAHALLKTWAPLEPPSRVVDALERELDQSQADALMDSLERWLPLVRLDLLFHHCRKT